MNDAAEVLFALAAVLLGVAVIIVVVKRGGRIEAELGKLHVKVDSVASTTEAIDKAVNQQPKRAPTLLQRVQRLEGHGRWQTHAIDCIARHVGCEIPLERPAE